MVLPESEHGSIAVTEGIRITVRSEYDPSRSAPDRQLWIFLYTVTIENEGEEIVQLLDRHWIITNESGSVQEVKGPGVVGEQPTLPPGGSFEYTSACPLNTPTGTMRGLYTLVRSDGRSFQARVGEFHLSETFLIN
ncbi:MAG: Co2+/Mg2+ efflux protein ApaG [Thermoanaerobaculia bacterium]|nr:Co2+/Mg2+ efflux protein ApaG [Thermoanaerobaculia bacterium]